MWKRVLAGTAALIITASTAALAQPFGHRHEGFRRGPATAEDMQAFADARLAALKAGLSLTEAQAAHWPAFEQAARDIQKLRIDRMKAQAERRNDPAAAGPAERLRRQGTTMADSGAALTKLADAVDPLYKSLDDNQKRRFAVLSRLGGPRDAFRRDEGRFHRRGDRDFRGPRFGRDFGRDEGRDAYGYDRREWHRGR